MKVDLPPASRVVVAMSGGVDSSATAAWLADQGHEVIGITLRLFDPEDPLGTRRRANPENPPCNESSAVRDARRVADHLGIRHEVLDLTDAFYTQVIAPFAASYTRGETPLPCALCNRHIKFAHMIAWARELGASALATGHYARRLTGSFGPTLQAATDPRRDQSYFLFATPREHLGFLHFPLGDQPSKTATRDLAAAYGLPVAAKPDSQDICFVPDGDHLAALRALDPAGSSIPGPIVDGSGHVVGHHEGITRFTVGQRKGLNLSARVGEANEPLYVTHIEPEGQRVVVGPRAALARSTVVLRDINWLGEDVPPEGLRVRARLRSAQAPVPATFALTSDGGGILTLDAPVFGIAPGQAGVLYDNDRVLGGGWISSAT